MISAKDDSTGTVFTDSEIFDQTITFLLAGHETTSVGIAWTLYCLSQHPDVADKVQKELSEVLAKEELQWETLDKLNYLGNVIKETLRLYPPAPIITRDAVKDDIIKGVRIPAKTAIIMSPGVMHKLPQYWEDPLKFDPDRWDRKNDTVTNFTYMPFITGPRSCIGNKFASIEMKTILAVLLSKFSFKVKEGYTVRKKLTITMRPYPGLPMVVTPLVKS
eukprot:TRINITY_DN4588_c0_g2_i2.p1 TRINITY_DN4588_c0_g2~~TRINITY_DN4588_c0_g2_i2.p1  ORF type:complete len:219 (+),score=33.97 TRINITY_DN4588_c0_g2_i2:210-866(+)